MFGSKAKQELENQLQELKERLSKEEKAKSSLEQELKSARETVADLKAQLEDTDYEELKAKSKETIAEYEGLKELYARKIQDFDAAKEEKEQQFAREAALQRYNLENEIRDNRQANQDYVSGTVKTFGETYNYYLNQIKVLMDALSDAASRTGSALFEQPNANLKENFGQLLAGTLKSETDELRGDDGNRIVIGIAEETEQPEAEPAEDTPDETVEEISAIIEDMTVSDDDPAPEEAIEEADAPAEE